MSLLAIDHLAFITPDLVGTIRFYRDLLGMELCAGVGHDGYRHYFFRFGANQVAFFAYEGAAKMERKFHGMRTGAPLGFDHVAFRVDTCEELFAFKDKLQAAGIEVSGPVDHGLIWSIYFFDPNEIPLEVTWECCEVLVTPTVADDQPLAIVAEGAAPQPGHWPAVRQPTPREAWRVHAGNGYAMRQNALSRGEARMKEELVRLLEAGVSR